MGLQILAASTAWPEDLLGDAATFRQQDVYRTFMGEDWEQRLAEKNRDWRQSSEVWGVETRGWLRGSDLDVLDLALSAARAALAEADCLPSELDCILVGTSTPARISSSVAGKVACALGCDGAAIDIRAGGAAGLDALLTAAAYLAQGCRRVLVIASEAPSLYLGAHDISNALLFGDGAAAILLGCANTGTSGESASGLCAARVGNENWQGKAFTIPGSLPPGESWDREDYCFQQPDKAYLNCLHAAWETANRSLPTDLPAQCEGLAQALPYAVRREQVLESAACFSAPAEHSLQLLKEHGCIGCASPLAGLVSYWATLPEAERNTGQHRVASVAVAGGISWTALIWAL